MRHVRKCEWRIFSMKMREIFVRSFLGVSVALGLCAYSCGACAEVTGQESCVDRESECASDSGEKNIKEQILGVQACLVAAIDLAIRPDGAEQKPVALTSDVLALAGTQSVVTPAGVPAAHVSVGAQGANPGSPPIGSCNEKTVSRLASVIRSFFGNAIAVGRFLHTVFGKR